MAFFLRPLTKPHSPLHHQSHRTLIDIAAIKWIRDRGLDHAVEKEKNLKPLLNTKNFIKSEPSKSAPISTITENKDSLKIPIRPIDFIRRYPSIFEQFFPGGIGIHPHVRLTPRALELDAEEQLIYQSERYRQEAADRLLKLLMLTRINRIPLSIVNRLKWDLGLPQDYVETLVPEFPDYFQIVGGKDGVSRALELVCWSGELAVSVMERKAATAFPLQYSRGFEMDKKFKKWVSEWQKLPYISPYENAAHLGPKSDESDKWAVGVLHELLHLLVSKKTERENVLCLGEYLGIRSRFKRALLNHPGIFYLSSKIGTHTVVLREAYKRDLLVEKHQLMGLRYQYIHLMNTVKETPKLKSAPGGDTRQQQQVTSDSKRGGEEEEDDEGGEEQDGEFYDSSNSEATETSDDDYDDDEKNEYESRRGAYKNVVLNRGRTTRKGSLEMKGSVRNPLCGRSNGGHPGRTRNKASPRSFRRNEVHSGHNVRGHLLERVHSSGSRGRSMPAGRTAT